MRNGSQLLNIRHIQLGIAQRLCINGPCLVVDQRAQSFKVVRVNKLHRDAQLRQHVVEQVICPPIKRSGRDNLLTCRGERGYDQRLRRLP